MTEFRDDPLLKIAEVARILAIGERTVQRYIATGEIRSLLLGRSRRVELSEVNRFREAAKRRGRAA